MNRLNRADGLTLIELIVTVGVLGVAFLAIVGGMTTSILASDIHRKEASAGAVLRTYAEALKRDAASENTHYVDCAAPSDYDPVVWTPDDKYVPSISEVEYWRSSDNSWQGGCSTDAGLQRLTLRVATADGRATETIQILKRKP